MSWLTEHKNNNNNNNPTSYLLVRKWGVRFLTVNKICFKHFVLLLLCVCVQNWSVSQWKQYELQIWSSWKRKKIERCHGIQPLKTDMLTGSTFDAFIHVHDESKHYLSHQFVQRRYCFKQCIRLSLSFVFGVRGSKISLGRTLCVLKCFMTSIHRQCSEERTLSFIKTLLQSLWYVTASVSYTHLTLPTRRWV